jgi:hypothetical protein
MILLNDLASHPIRRYRLLSARRTRQGATLTVFQKIHEISQEIFRKFRMKIP